MCVCVHRCFRRFLRSADYTHVVMIGTNEITRVVDAITRYSLGGVGYQDPVDFDKVFEVDPATGFPVLDEDGLPVPTFAPMIEVSVPVWSWIKQWGRPGFGRVRFAYDTSSYIYSIRSTCLCNFPAFHSDTSRNCKTESTMKTWWQRHLDYVHHTRD